MQAGVSQSACLSCVSRWAKRINNNGFSVGPSVEWSRWAEGRVNMPRHARPSAPWHTTEAAFAINKLMRIV